MEALRDLGLWGDGDEIWAIEAAFGAIEMAVPVEDAPNWWTVGDVWHSAVCRRPELNEQSKAWDDFRTAISGETLAPWERVQAETLLIDGKGHNILSRLLKGIWHKMKSDA